MPIKTGLFLEQPTSTAERHASFFLLRVTIASSLLWAYLRGLWFYDDFFSPHGVGGVDFVRWSAGQVISRPAPWWPPWQTLLSREPIAFGLYVLLLVALALLLTGWKTRWSALAVFVLHWLWRSRFEYVHWGWAELCQPFLLYLALDRSRLTLAIIRAHVAILYLMIAVSRIHSPAWIDHSAVYRILTDPFFSRWPNLWVSWPEVGRAGTLFWTLEMLAPALLLWKRSRHATVFALVLMHLMLELFTLVGAWNFLMVAALTAWLPSTWTWRHPFRLNGEEDTAGSSDPRFKTSSAQLAAACYVALLFCGAWRFVHLGPVLTTGVRGANRLLGHVGITPGLGLFVDEGPLGPIVRGNCVRIEVTSAPGAPLARDLTPEYCRDSQGGWAQPLREMVVLRLLYDAYELRHTRGKLRVAAILFDQCRRLSPSSSVRLTWMRRFADPAREVSILEASWSCARASFMDFQWSK